MTKRAEPRRTFRFAVTNVPAGLDIESIIANAVREFGGTAIAAPAPVPVKPAAAKPKRTPLKNRTTRAAATFPCRRLPSGLFAAAVAWPTGVPKKGCGRVFTSEKRRDIHEAGTEWNAKVFPNGCLDRILPAGLRDTR